MRTTASTRWLVAVVAAWCGATSASACAAFEQSGGDEVGGEVTPSPAPAPPVPACRPDAAAGPIAETWSLEVNGETRRFHIFVPANVAGDRPVPVVLNFHGLVMTGAWQAEVSGALAKAAAQGFIVLHPEGTGAPRGWNAGACCAPASTSGVDDVAFVDAMLAAVRSRYCVDDARIYAMGFSNGGFLAHRLACERADVFAAVASVAGVLGLDACAPSRPVAVMQVHGTHDLVVPYDSRLSAFASVPATLARWQQLNACAATTTSVFEAGEASCRAYDGCAAGGELVHCVVDGGGHQWPGGEAIPGGGHLSEDLRATDAIWSFFVAHARD